MPKYRVDLVARLVGFREIEVEADNEHAARQEAWKQGQELGKEEMCTSEWDIEYVDYRTHSTERRRSGPGTVYEVEINEINKIP